MHQPVLQRPGTTQGPGPLSRLERTVLAALLAGDGDSDSNSNSNGWGALRAQLARATVISRTHSGVGFVTRIDVPDEIPSLADSLTPRLRPVLAVHPQLAERAEFLLQLRSGRLAVLEAYCFEGVWPADETEFRVVGSSP
ncbi:MAG: hypothetical protein ABI661_10180 [Gammaproteobacteria bacterium]